MPEERERETCWSEIDLDALRSNFRLASRLLPADTPILTVVKADAYGHGAVEVSRVLVEEGAAALSVATVPEAAELRKAGIQAPILVMGRMLDSEVEGALRWRTEITIAHAPHRSWARPVKTRMKPAWTGLMSGDLGGLGGLRGGPGASSSSSAASSSTISASASAAPSISMSSSCSGVGPRMSSSNRARSSGRGGGGASTTSSLTGGAPMSRAWGGAMAALAASA